MKQSTRLNDHDANTIVIQTNNSLFNLACIAIIGGISLSVTLWSQRQNKRQQAATETAVSRTRLNTQTQQQLHDILDDYFDDQELRDVCFDMGVDYEDLPCSGQTYKARELVSLCRRLGKIAQLKAVIIEKRPDQFPELSHKSMPAHIDQPNTYFPQSAKIRQLSHTFTA